MAQNHNPLHKFILVREPSSPLLKAVVTVAIALCTVTLIALRYTQLEQQKVLALLHTQAAAIEQENADLADRIQSLGTAKSIRRIAAEELGLVDPDTIIFDSESE